jgi:hypothetical protein
MARRLGCLSAAALLASCAASVQHTPLRAGHADHLSGRSLVVVAHEKPSFLAGSAAKGMLGGFGALAMISEGDEIVQANNVQDPALEVGEEIATALAARYDVAVHHPVELSDSDDVWGLTQRYAGSDLILFTRTRDWKFMYFPTDWDNYRVGLSLVVMLIDADTGSTLAAADCAYWPEYADSDQAPTRVDLLADNAAGLKAELKKGAAYCTQKFLNETFV